MRTHQGRRQHWERRRWRRRRRVALDWVGEQRAHDVLSRGLAVDWLLHGRLRLAGLVGRVNGEAARRVLHRGHVTLQNLRNHGNRLQRSCSVAGAGVSAASQTIIVSRTAAHAVDVQQHVRHVVLGIGEDAAAVERQMALARHFHGVNRRALYADDQAHQAVRNLLRVVHQLQICLRRTDGARQQPASERKLARVAPTLPPGWKPVNIASCGNTP